MSTDNDSSDSGGHCSTADSDGEVAEEIAIISFSRKMETAKEIKTELDDRYEAIDIIEYHGEVFDEHWGAYDCFIGLMASGIAMRKPPTCSTTSGTIPRSVSSTKNSRGRSRLRAATTARTKWHRTSLRWVRFLR